MLLLNGDIMDYEIKGNILTIYPSKGDDSKTLFRMEYELDGRFGLPRSLIPLAHVSIRQETIKLTYLINTSGNEQAPE
jgi:hypothetical protein